MAEKKKTIGRPRITGERKISRTVSITPTLENKARKLYGNLGSARSSIPVILFICISIAIWVFLFGIYNNEKFQLINLFFVSFGTILIIGFTSKQFITSTKFSKAYEYRINYILSRKNSKSKTILVQPLPDSGILASQEVGGVNTKYSITSYYLGKVNGINKAVYLK